MMRTLLMLLMSLAASGWVGVHAAWAASTESDLRPDEAAPAETRAIGCRASRRTSPLVIKGNTSITGGLLLEHFQEVQRRSSNSIDDCYARELTKTPTLSGKLLFQLLISNDGSVIDVSVEEDTMGAEHGLGPCIEARLLRWEFPMFGGEHALVSLPLIFSPPPKSGIVIESSTSIQGGISLEQFDEIVRRNFSSLKACYQRELRIDPTLTGTLAFQFKIGNDGWAFDFSIRNLDEMGEARREGLGKCIMHRLRRMRFPANEEGDSLVDFTMFLSPYELRCSEPQ